MDPRITLVRADTSTLIAALRSGGEHRFRRVIELTTNASATAHRSRYRELRTVADREIRVFWQNRLTLSAMSRLWVRNLIENLTELPYGLPAPRFAGPVAVCGAGPSLERALPTIRELRNQLSVVAVDTAVPVLASAGITPDVVVALEGQLANAYDFLPVARREYLLVADLCSDPTTVRLHKRRSWTLTSFASYTLVERASRLPGIGSVMPPLGSVGVAAVRYALDRTDTLVLLTGLDFAVQAGKTHARGAPSYRTYLAASDRLHPIPDPALRARLVSLPGYGRANVASTLVLKGYAEELADIVGSRPNVVAIEPFGLQLNARPIAASEVREILGSLAHDGGASLLEGTSDATATAKRMAVVERFVRAELSLVEEHDFCDGVPAELDYLAAEIPEKVTGLAGRVALAPLDPSARARLRVAADYFRERWLVTLERLAVAASW